VPLGALAVHADGAGGEVDVFDLQPPQLVTAEGEPAHEQDAALVA
jgi:hypothetical protein